MITLFILLMILAVVFMAVSGVAIVLIDPIIAIVIIYGVYRLIKFLVTRGKKQSQLRSSKQGLFFFAKYTRSIIGKFNKKEELYYAIYKERIINNFIIRCGRHYYDSRFSIDDYTLMYNSKIRKFSGEGI